MKEQFSRTALIFGEQAINVLNSCRVAVFGIGGVGGHTVEALARSGIGSIDIIDPDKVTESNINRQLVATHSTVGRFKTDVMSKRIQDINPDCVVTSHNVFLLPETADSFDFSKYDYIVDAVDTVAAKVTLVEKAKEYGVPVICAMGAGNKTDPTLFKVSDINKTKVCPLAKAVRIELRKRGIAHVKVVYSEEAPIQVSKDIKEGQRIPGSVPFVPSVMGLIIAAEVVKDLVATKEEKKDGKKP